MQCLKMQNYYEVSTSDVVLQILCNKPYSSMQRELAKRPVIGVHWVELNILFADGTVKNFWHWKLPISQIEAMSRVRK